ncbi:hypothetical protein GOARA_048_00780 [Gordonia araii NBRC 100433]|uniref:DUF5926 domain-containing protein n=1 Tax=Gordonia araii NBRC 100433 TaxID=1073574 RepID=G7H201_9ACTN|nr:DUF5926 family protein [Gordonia araii]NNG97209.1 hypothetical protein [Gordonia araii NBRC 100433]GAB09876.1 hypothetical protein GOARA_048_00780 [Gordonia araii NBRC 100433]
MGKKSKRGSGPRPGSNRAERVAARKERQAAAAAAPKRPFEGLAAECDLVALRTFVASATARLSLIEPGPPEPELKSVVPDDEPGPSVQKEGVRNHVSVGTVLPGAVGAMVRDGKGAREGFAGLQVDPEPADIAAEFAAAVDWAAHAKSDEQFPGEPTDKSLADLLDVDAPLDITVHEDFAWWYAPGAKLEPAVREMLDNAAGTITPAARMTPKSGLGAPWWADAGERAHLRWVRPEDEDAVMTAMARLHADGHLTLGEGSRFAGSFRTHGLIVPVFDLDPEKHSDEWYDGLDQFDAWLVEAMADKSELTGEQRRSRAGIRTRQITLRI